MIIFFDVLSQIPQLASSYIGVWLRDDFQFNRRDVAQALRNLARIVVRQKISVDSPLVNFVTSLEAKYLLNGYFTQFVILWVENADKLPSKVCKYYIQWIQKSVASKGYIINITFLMSKCLLKKVCRYSKAGRFVFFLTSSPCCFIHEIIHAYFIYCYNIIKLEEIIKSFDKH